MMNRSCRAVNLIIKAKAGILASMETRRNPGTPGRRGIMSAADGYESGRSLIPRIDRMAKE